MRRECHDGRALALAQLARRAADVVALRRRADYHRAARWRRGVGGLCAGHHHYHRAGILIGQIIGIGQIISAQIDSKSPSIGMANPCDAGRVAVVRISKAPAASIGRDQLAKFHGIDRAVNLGQIACLIVAPQLAIGQRCDRLGELAPRRASRAFRDCRPM